MRTLQIWCIFHVCNMMPLIVEKFYTYKNSKDSSLNDSLLCWSLTITRELNVSSRITSFAFDTYKLEKETNFGFSPLSGTYQRDGSRVCGDWIHLWRIKNEGPIIATSLYSDPQACCCQTCLSILPLQKGKLDQQKRIKIIMIPRNHT